MTQLIEALRCNRKGSGFDFRKAISVFGRLNPSGHTVAVGWNQLLTEKGTRGDPWRGGGGRGMVASAYVSQPCQIHVNLLIIIIIIIITITYWKWIVTRWQ